MHAPRRIQDGDTDMDVEDPSHDGGKDDKPMTEDDEA
jgi:hypothetical protein